MIIGDLGYAMKGEKNTDNITNITINNIIYNSTREGIRIDEYLKDSVISNVISTCKTHPMFAVQHDGAFINCKFSNIQTPDEVETIGNFWKYHK